MLLGLHLYFCDNAVLQTLCMLCGAPQPFQSTFVCLAGLCSCGTLTGVSP